MTMVSPVRLGPQSPPVRTRSPILLKSTNAQQSRHIQQPKVIMVAQTATPNGLIGSTYKSKIQADVESALQDFGMEIDRVFA